jgi:hypothetical protein
MVLRFGRWIVPMLLAAATACGSSQSTTAITTTTATTATTATTTTTTTPPQDANVSGVVLAGPTCPVVTREQPCPPRPVETEIEARNAAGETVAHTRTDANGRYALALTPGAYTVIAATGPGGPMFCDPVDVTVPTGPGPVVQADISCDTGIR